MIKKLYYVRTNGYDMVVSVDAKGRVKSITKNNEFPILREDTKEEQARKFLESIEDDSEWEDFGIIDDLDEWMGTNLSHDQSEIITEIEKLLTTIKLSMLFLCLLGLSTL